MEFGAGEESDARGAVPTGSAPHPTAPSSLGRRLARAGALIASDLLALLVSATMAYLLWAMPVRKMPPDLYLELTPLLVLFILGYAQAGLYPGFGLGPVETLRRSSLVTGFCFAVLAAFSFALKLPHLYSRMTFGIAFGLSLIAVPLMRFLTISAAVRWNWWAGPVLLLGDGPGNRRAIAALRDSPALGYRPMGILTQDPSQSPKQIEGLPVLGGLDRAPQLARAGISVALLDPAAFDEKTDLDWLQQHFRHVMIIRGYEGLPVEGVQLRNLGGVLGIEYYNNLLERRNRWIKRVLDLVLAAWGLVLSIPVIVASAVCVKLISPGPAFFLQERVGYRGKRFRIPKIRTMRADASERLGQHLAADPDMKSEWARGFKLKSDPRIIPHLGHFLRRYSLDELPQLWSVIRGEMSLVGPRPFPEYHLSDLSEAARTLRQRVRPGMTGLWQVTARGEGDIETQEAFDLYYIRNWSIWLDIYILARTFSAVLSGRGAY